MLKMEKLCICYRVHNAQNITLEELRILIKIVFFKYTVFREDDSSLVSFPDILVVVIPV